MFCVLLGPAGRTAMFFCGPPLPPPPTSSEALPTCVIVWPLSACLQQRARLCSSPRHPPSPPPAYRSLDASLRTPTDSLPPPQPRAALSELAHLYSVYYYCCARVCPQQPPPSLSCKDHFIRRRRRFDLLLFFSVALMDLPLCISFYIVCFRGGEARCCCCCCRWWCRWWLCSDNNDFFFFFFLNSRSLCSVELLSCPSLWLRGSSRGPPPPSWGDTWPGNTHQTCLILVTGMFSRGVLWRLCRPPPPSLIPNLLVFDRPHSHWCFMFNSGSTQLHLEPPQLTTAFHFYAKTGGLRSQPPTRSYI